MNMTVKELIEEILSIEKVDTKSNLQKKKKAELEKILQELREKHSDKKNTVEEASSALDIEALKKQLMEEMRETIKAELEEELREERTESQDVVVTTPKRKIRPQIDRHEQIPVMNITYGNLIYRSRRTGMEVKWSEYGDVEYLEFQELITMRSGDRLFFDEPFILILDEDVVEYFGLEKQYDKIDQSAISNCLKLPFEDFKRFVIDSPRGVQSTVVAMVRDKVRKGEFDSLRTIKFLEDTFQIEIREE